ncbi:MAG: tetratricopeptide repeat protein [Bryobacteraceae bacterium]|nr:tetratricopeptide repeat protein [Bryobacteraceae bacterium]
MPDERISTAIEIFQQAYQRQMEGELDLAVSLYKHSIQLHPTAEAYTFLGWTYRFQGKLDEAIEECKKAIATDPSFGNPYNDIGAYLIEQGKPEDAIPWLEQAIASKRYEAYHYPWYNLGRVYVAMEWFNKARDCFRKALQVEPRYTLAQEALDRLRTIVQ